MMTNDSQAGGVALQEVTKKTRKNLNQRMVSKYWLGTVELLRIVKGEYTYRELEKLTGLPQSVLARYFGGYVCANVERAEELTEKLLNAACLHKLVARKIERDDEGYMDTSKVLADPVILELATRHAIHRAKRADVTRVVAASLSGIPLATLIAQYFGVNIANAEVILQIPETVLPTKTVGLHTKHTQETSSP